ncbi:hypothetical protein TWF730_001491 [Orbilia blumenaviensis]|uniref:Uncharacterized protein n=1 Tax=Orbilia blumenaviensis TaxID=1796055 RepID=A0AAV9UI23_9PEZI
MRATRIIRHTTQSAQGLWHLNNRPGCRRLSTIRRPYLQRPVLEYPLTKGTYINRGQRYYQGGTIYEYQQRNIEVTSPSGEAESVPVKGVNSQAVSATRVPTPPPRPAKNPKTLYSWEPIESNDYGLGPNACPKINVPLVGMIGEKLQAATREAISLPDELHQAHYRNAYKELGKDPAYDVPVTNPPSKTIAIIAVDEIWSEHCRVCPCFCEDDIPYIRVHGSTANGGKGVTFKIILEEVGDWLYGENAEEILEGERGRIGLTLLNYLEPGGDHEGILDATLYWYLSKAEEGVKIGV